MTLNTIALIGTVIVTKRNVKLRELLKNNSYLLILYCYLLLSILWSDYPFESFKRWFKVSIPVIMALVVISEKNPYQALESVLRRCAYILLPFSVVLIKYFPNYGVVYDRWEGTRMGTGVTTHKNSLGVLCAIMLLTMIWSNLGRHGTEEFPVKRKRISADAIVVLIGAFLLFGGGGTFSATSIVVFALGFWILVILHRRNYYGTWLSHNIRIATLIGIFLFATAGGLLKPLFTSLIGRSETLSGRSEIWDSVMRVASENPILGVGYGGYWGLSTGAYKMHFEVMQSHSGYLEVYLQVGVVGIFFLFLWVFEFLRNVQRGLSEGLEMAVLAGCFAWVLLLYNYSEAAFLEANCMWNVAVFLAICLSLMDGKENVTRGCVISEE